MDTREYQATQDTTGYPGVTAEMEAKGIKEIQVRKNAQILLLSCVSVKSETGSYIGLFVKRQNQNLCLQE